ncbi:MAG: sugar phosphate isomerase/epimerase family protein [Spirochaetota bacterium]
MKPAICHYSFHRTWVSKGWSVKELAQAVKELGADGIDFHTRYLGDAGITAKDIKEALRATRLHLCGLSISNDFNQIDPTDFLTQIKTVIKWIEFASVVKAPVSRIFGGSIDDRKNKDTIETGIARVINALGEVVRVAEKNGVVLALENHGGLPGTGEEQVRILQAINSPSLRATVDMGNYLECGQEGEEGTKIAAPYAAYVHIKDYKKVSDRSNPWGWTLKNCAVGEGDVNHKKCIEILKESSYDGYIALEYEGTEVEETGVMKSFNYMKKLLEI